jgi:Holliday junction DNA helicase RuvA
MIASLTGRLKRKATDHLVIDVAGVGYQVQTPLSTYYNLPDAGEEVALHIYTHVREDALSLYGFLSEKEKDVFLLLLGVSGIGPKLALAVLSSLSAEDISYAIESADDLKLCAIPGIGRKTAARLVLELKDKMKRLSLAGAHDERLEGKMEPVEDAVSALVNLGYKKTLAEETLQSISRRRPGLNTEALIREGLAVLTKC